MPKVSGASVVKRRRRKKILKAAKGYWGAKSRQYKRAKEAVIRSGVYAYRDRKVRKREFRTLWISRVSAACRANGISYSQFIKGLTLAEIDLNRKMLSEIAIHHPEEFTKIVEKVQQHLN